MKLGTGHTAQQCSTAYRSQRVSGGTPQKPNGHTDCAMPVKARKKSVSVVPLKSAERGKHKYQVTNESSRSSNDGSESETNGNRSHLSKRTMQSRRRKVKGHSTDATTSEDSDMESTCRSQLAKPRPALIRKKVERQKVLETSVLDWSHSMRTSSQVGSGKEEAARMMHMLKYGGSDELPSDGGKVVERKFSDKDLRNLRQ